MKKNSKSQIKKAKASFNKAGEGLSNIAIGTAKTTLNTAKGIYETVDSADLAISEKIDHKLGESSNKIIFAARKNIIKTLLAASLLVYGGNKVITKINEKNIDKIEIISNKDQDKEKIDNENNATLLNLKELDYKIKTPDGLVGRNLGNLYSYYLGYHGKSSKIGDTIVFNPDKILEELYTKKFNLDNDKGFTAAKSHYENTIKNMDFNSIESININIMKNKMKESIKLVNKNFDREKFGSEKLKNNTEKTKLFKSLCNKIDEKALLSYGMTELMPSSDGKLNQEVLDFMLQNGGEKFVMNIPAIADSYASFGLYQFTSFAVYDTGDELRGASIMNQYLPSEHKIAGSVTKLATEDHHKTAYMFAMYNLYSLVFEANAEMMKALNLLLKQNDNNNLTQLIAIMHNYPANGSVFLKEWSKLNTDKKYAEKKQGKNKEKYNYDINKNNQIDLYEVYVGNHNSKKFDSKSVSHTYGKKTYHNRNSL